MLIMTLAGLLLFFPMGERKPAPAAGVVTARDLRGEAQEVK